MGWKDLPLNCKRYLVCTYILAIPFASFCFKTRYEFPTSWVLLTTASFLIAGINVSLRQIPSVVVSMGDVFTVLALIHYGAGPALITYWANVLATAVAGYLKKYGHNFLRNVSIHRLLFNVACCTFSIFAMSTVYRLSSLPFGSSNVSFEVALLNVAIAWFLVNTGTVSIAVSMSSGKPLFAVWRQGLNLYLANCFGSAAAAGLLSLLYKQTDFSVFILSIPIAVVLYLLHSFHNQKYEQANKHIEELNKLYLQTIETMATAVDAKDRYTHGHIRRVQVYGTELARRMGITEENELMAMRAGALLHDIGKIAIPEYILNKPASLTESEYEKMKLHPVVGANMLRNIDFPYPVLPLVRSHHERWDGNGYPDRLKGEEIPLSARILSLVDCYDALTTNRPYRSPMPRVEIIEFFQRESGKAYDPAVVEVFVNNLAELEKAASEAIIPTEDIWGIREDLTQQTPTLRPLEKVQPTITYSKALSGNAELERHFYAIFEFARAPFHCLSPKDVLVFMGSKLSQLISFDAAAFYVADLNSGIVSAQHVLGAESKPLENLALPLEQKLSGWAAANNQALCNLPPFPDFLHYQGDQPSFQLSAIAPMNRNGSVVGAVSLYRRERVKFSEDEFRRLELIASQTALALTKCSTNAQEGALFDALTGLPNGYQLYLMFDQIATDANKFDYPVALLAIRLDDQKLRRRWGHIVGDEAIRTAATYLSKELRETDLLVRYAGDEFVVVVPRVNREQAEGLKSRFQDELDHFRFQVRPGSHVPLSSSIGIAMYGEDATDVDGLIVSAEWRMQEDADLRLAARRAAFDPSDRKGGVIKLHDTSPRG